jgi:hypothetical protein
LIRSPPRNPTMPGISPTLDRPSHTTHMPAFAVSPRGAETGFGESLAASLATVPARRFDAPTQLEQRSAPETDEDDDDADAADEAQGSSRDAQRLPENDAHHTDKEVSEAGDEVKDAPPSPPTESPAKPSDDADRATAAANEPQATPHRAEADAKLHSRDENSKQPRSQPQSQGSNENRPADSRSTQAQTQAPVQGPSEDEDTPSPSHRLTVSPSQQQEQPNIEPRGRDRMDAAVARAMQIETAIRLENATGQTATPGDGSARPGPHTGIAIQGAAAITGNGVNLGGEQNAHLPQQANIDDERFTGRIVRGLTTMINQRGGAMTMRLDPPELGQLRVQMTISRGIVAAQFTASTAQAHALLDKNMATLRLALESQGLTVDRLSVHSTQSGSSQHHAMNDHASDKHNHQRQDAGHGQSRGRRDDAHEHESRGRAAGFASLVANMSEDGGDAS